MLVVVKCHSFLFSFFGLGSFRVLPSLKSDESKNRVLRSLDSFVYHQEVDLPLMTPPIDGVSP